MKGESTHENKTSDCSQVLWLNKNRKKIMLFYDDLFRVCIISSFTLRNFARRRLIISLCLRIQTGKERFAVAHHHLTSFWWVASTTPTDGCVHKSKPRFFRRVNNKVSWRCSNACARCARSMTKLKLIMRASAFLSLHLMPLSWKIYLLFSRSRSLSRQCALWAELVSENNTTVRLHKRTRDAQLDVPYFYVLIK